MTQYDEKKYPHRNFVERTLLDDGTPEDTLDIMTANEKFEAWLNYEGIIGYASHIKDVIETLYGVKLDA